MIKMMTYLIILGWVITAVLFVTIIARTIIDFGLFDGRLKEHSERLEMLMNLKQDRPGGSSGTFVGQWQPPTTPQISGIGGSGVPIFTPAPTPCAADETAVLVLTTPHVGEYRCAKTDAIR